MESKNVELLEAESRMVVARAWGPGKGGVKGAVSAVPDEYILEV